MNRQSRKPRAIAIAKAREAETANLKTLTVLCIGACLALAAMAFTLAG